MPVSPPSPHRTANKWLWAALALSLVGLATSWELTSLHRLVHLDPAHQSFCAVNATVNCDSVARSSYSVFLGAPVSVWGLLGYATILLVALAGWRLRRPAFAAGALLLLSAFAAVTSLGLGILSFLAISSICLLCLATYAVNAALLFVAWRLWRALPSGEAFLELRRFLSSMAGTVAVVVAAGAVAGISLAYPKYWLKAPVSAAIASPLSSGAVQLGRGKTTQGNPWIGATTPKFVIEEFSDYQCPHCAQSNLLLRALVEHSPEELRVVHRHYPLSGSCNSSIKSTFHLFACQYAVFASCAEEQELFWPVNDYLFAHGHQEEAITLEQLRREVPSLDLGKLQECIASGRGLQTVQRDIEEGQRIPVDGTPTYRVNGKLHDKGRLPEELLAPYFRKLAE